jgi:prepilin-type N-terminal cleavage/methylation domain-containing protein
MNFSRSNTDSTAQKGFTLVELMIAALILATAVTITINVFGINMSQSSQARNQLKASGLARAKLDAYKDYARRTSLSGAFTNLTVTDFANSYNLTTNVARVNDLDMTWRVQPSYVYQNGSVVADATSLTVNNTKLVRLYSSVSYRESGEAKLVTLTTYVSDITP